MRFSIRSIRPSSRVPGLAYPLRARSSRPTEARYGRKIDLGAARCFVLPCRWLEGSQHDEDSRRSFTSSTTMRRSARLLANLLSACGYRVALYESAKQLLKTPPSDEPACILLDVQMAGLSGPQLQDHLAELGSRLPIVFVTGHADIPTSVRTIKAGAEDFLIKPVPKEKLLESIKRALVRYEEMREQDSRIAVLRSLLSRLTPREHEVFALLVRGHPHKQIAYALGTSERTVKMHRHNVMQKFEVQIACRACSDCRTSWIAGLRRRQCQHVKLDRAPFLDHQRYRRCCDPSKRLRHRLHAAGNYPSTAECSRA